MKLLLARSISVIKLGHILLCAGVFLVWSSVFFYGQTVNIITLQFIFIMVLGSFFLISRRFGVFYSVLAIFPIAIFILTKGRIEVFNQTEGALVSPAYEIIVILNFITIIVIHDLFNNAFTKNVEEKINLNIQFENALVKANEAANSKTDFLSTMSHELRTPLNSVIGMTDLLLSNPINEEQAETLKALKFSSTSLHSLINDILDFNKIGSDKLMLEAVKVNLNRLIKDICSGLNFQAKEKGIQLNFKVDERLHPIYVITDPTRLSQIIYNLVGNAIKFTSKGSVQINLEVINHSEEKIKVKFSVIDTGLGIKEEDQERIFEVFKQASLSTTRNYGGTGLGLAIVKKLVEMLGSKIQLTSEIGIGSDFYFEVSFDISNDLQVINEDDINEVFDLEQLKVLVAEDNAMNRLLLKKVFSKWNSELVFVENGLEAIEKASTDDFDVILMDLHMPLVDGYEATKSIRELQDVKKANVHIIALTASVSNNMEEKIIQSGMNGFMYKPFNANDMYATLKGLIKVNPNKSSKDS
ncbi:MAG: response regulator [Bacteroidetes bacterium]|nr:response regulator [Bacteroidota bacterium]MBU1485024.1 response regulator [Bacteroidota bacterium]MBU1761770.1 response regulator [Bacteroidota bacterium]MBU2269311.1 response regulator [Bacteroidota bacterium]MBU2374833.1 response regulator [Bacteroidota bacterium]